MSEWYPSLYDTEVFTSNALKKMGHEKSSISRNPHLFYVLVAFCVVIALILTSMICWWLLRRYCWKKTKPPQINIIGSGISEPDHKLPYSTELINQQIPINFEVPQSVESGQMSLLDSPRSGRSNSVDIAMFDVDLYNVEENVSVSSGHIGFGKLCISVCLDINSKKLVVTLIRGIYIPSKYGNQQPCVYVKIQLLPEKRHKRRQTRTHKGSNPEFSEEFVFYLHDLDLENRSLKFTVFDYDRFSKSQVIGYTYFSLKDKFEEISQAKGTGEIWLQIEDSDVQDGDEKGEILIALSYLPTAGRITVNLVKGKGISMPEKDSSGGTLAVKVSIFTSGKPTRTKKVFATGDDMTLPFFNRTFVFDVASDIMEQISLTFVVCIYPNRGPKKVLGRIVIGPIMYTQGSGLEHWKEMLFSPRHSVSRWHKIL